MKFWLRTPPVFLVFFLCANASGAVRYVNVNSGSPSPPYTSWATAANKIQDAIDTANAGDLVLVTNGVYQSGGLAVNGETTNRVAITKAITVRSVNGPRVTIIRGQTNGVTIRCAYVTNDAVLAGFALTNGAPHTTSSEPPYTDLTGGGVWCEAESAVVSNCVISGCFASDSGGGAYGGTLRNCQISGNSAGSRGGGASQSTLMNCTLTSNSALMGGGANICTLHNSILFYNQAPISDPNYSASTLDFCCTTPLPAGGSGNTAAEPQLTDPGHIGAASPCRSAGSAVYSSGSDIDREAWLNPPSIGCDEYYGGSITGALSVACSADYTNVAAGFNANCKAVVVGHASANKWDFGDGTIVSNRLYVSHSWATPGNFAVIFRAYNDSNPGGLSATVTVHVVSQPVYYVSRSNATPVAPYGSWGTAATNIQDAVDAVSAAGSLVLVTNGYYDTGGRSVGGTTNRVAITKALVLQSVNGAAVTVVDGKGTMPCVYLANGGALAGLTLTNGSGGNGGGVSCESFSAVVSNCVMIGNGGGAYFGTLANCTLVANSGGGAYGATLKDCVVAGNDSGGANQCRVTNCLLTTNSSFFGAGASSSVLVNCSLIENHGIGGGGGYACTFINCNLVSNTAAWYSGGGAKDSTLINCTLTGNSGDSGGGTEGGTLSRCTLTGNWAYSGGGADNGYLTNCVVTGNWAFDNGGGVASSTVYNSVLSANSATNTGGGVDSSTLGHCTLTGNSSASGGGAARTYATNCILYYNNSPEPDPNSAGNTLSYCCTTPLPPLGVGNITNAPQLTDLMHIAPTSPCRAVGFAAATLGTDLDGEVWLNPPSIGCDEYYAGPVTGALSVAIQPTYTNVATGFPIQFLAQISGRASVSRWDFGDGTIVSNQPYASHSWSIAGDYLVTLQAYNSSFPTGVSATVSIHVVTQPVHYVFRANTTPTAPYTSWATAATNIQDAVNAVSVPGALVLVTNGVYDAGGAVWNGENNRVVVTTPVTLQSVNGPLLTVISGGGSARGAYLASGSAFLGFSVTNGNSGPGGGVFCQSASVIVSNCVFRGNSAGGSGGGARQGTFHQCTFTANSTTYGGGASSCVLNNCVISNNSGYFGGGAHASLLSGCSITGNSSVSGGGGYNCTFLDCTLSGNRADDGGGANGGVLSRCRILANSSTSSGGGISGAIVNNSVLVTNFASAYGGGAYGGILNSCALFGNWATNSGGGCEASTLNNCTLTDNSAISAGGGAFSSTLNNCIVFYNHAPTDPNYSETQLNYCCATPLPTNGVGNIAGEPQLVDPAHISAASPCRGAGSAAYVSGTDIDGDVWANPPSIGSDEYVSGAITGALTAAIQIPYTNLAAGYVLSLTGQVTGHASSNRWDFSDGSSLTNRLYASHAWLAGGDYAIVLTAYNESYPAGDSTTAIVHVVQSPIHYVSLAGTNPVPPFFSWATAATNLQQAADVAYAGGIVLASNGIYQTGGRVVSGVLTNRLVVAAPVTVQGLNGAAATVIRGNATNGDDAVRCAYLANGAVLSGFTLTAGGTRTAGEGSPEQNGGGVWCASTNETVMNCTFTGNSADYEGGGAYGGLINNCTFLTNTAYAGGGASAGILNNCLFSSNSATYGGGAGNALANHCVLWNNSAGSGGAAYSSTLTGCVLTNNSAGDGGGAYSSQLLSCLLKGNTASDRGGGANSCTLLGCALAANTSTYIGGGVEACTLTNCTLTGNEAVTQGGGANGSMLYNCIVYYNWAISSPNYETSTLDYCCALPFSVNGTGNTDDEPQLADFSHLSAGSPLRGAGGSAFLSGTDIDGEAWLNPPSIGSDEYHAGAITGPLSVGIRAPYTNVVVGFGASFVGDVAGHASSNRWDFGDGTFASNRPYATHSWLVAGNYVVVFRAFNETVPGGVSTSLVVHVEPPFHYVAANNATPAAPFASWATAATNIQDAVDVAFAGATVLVSNGVYAAGGAIGGGASNRVATSRPLTLQSANGPATTVIQGGTDMRGVYLTNGTSIAGFNVTGASIGADGGGVYCESTAVTVSNCVFLNNYSDEHGGGGYAGTYSHCAFTNNSARLGGGGVWLGGLNDCSLSGGSSSYDGGAAANCSLTHCVLTGNSARNGGGARYSTLNWCTLSTNVASYGGGAEDCTLNNCFLFGNSAAAGGSGNGGGVSGCSVNNSLLVGNSANATYGYGGASGFSTLYDCTLYGNSAGNAGGADYYGTLYNCIIYNNNAPGGSLTASSLGPCWVGDPLFVNAAAGDFHLQTNSPCIDSGDNDYVSGTSDLDGNRRIIGDALDYGAYEFVPADVAAFIAWLQQYGLPTDGSADYTDSDGDLMNNYQEWIAGTNPTNALSALRVLTLVRSGSGMTVTWQSVTNRSYFIERSTNLNAQATFLTVATNVPGQAGTTSYTDTNASGTGPFYYRVGIWTDSYVVLVPPPFTLWLQYYGLPTDGSADFADTDGDHLNNYQEWLAGTIPTNALSALRMVSSVKGATGIDVTWQTVTNRSYFLQRSTNLTAQPAFLTIATNLLGQLTTTTYTDTNTPGAGPFFYRVGVQP